jgi:hypothetical protein
MILLIKEISERKCIPAKKSFVAHDLTTLFTETRQKRVFLSALSIARFALHKRSHRISFRN